MARGQSNIAPSSNLLFGTRKATAMPLSALISERQEQELLIKRIRARHPKMPDFAKVFSNQFDAFQLTMNDDGAVIVKGQTTYCFNQLGQLHNEQGPAIKSPEKEAYWQNGFRHREGGPALLNSTLETEQWFIQGKHHREGGPACTYADRKEWCLDGELHRTDGPAIERNDGSFEYYRHGKIHREGGPAIFYADKNIHEWLVDGLYHREDGPAIVTPLEQEWRIKGKRHRVDGPAMTDKHGVETWFLFDVRYRYESDWQAAIKDAKRTGLL